MQSGCVICYDSFEASSNAAHQKNDDKVNIVTTMCGHVFHSNCIKEWLKRSPTCPECRRHVRRKSLTKLFINFCIDNLPDINAERALQALEKQLCEKDLECVEKDKKIKEVQNCCAHFKIESMKKDAKIEELQTCFARSELDSLEKDKKIEELQIYFVNSELGNLVKDAKIEELQTCLAHSELESLEKEKKILELELCIAHTEIESLENVKKLQNCSAHSKLESLEKDEKIKTIFAPSERAAEKMLQQQMKLNSQISVSKKEEKNLNHVKAKNQNLLQEKYLKCMNNILDCNNDKRIMERCFTVIKKILVQVRLSSKEGKIATRRIAAHCTVLLQLLSHPKVNKTYLLSGLKKLKQKPSQAEEDETQLPIKLKPTKHKLSAPQADCPKRLRLI